MWSEKKQVTEDFIVYHTVLIKLKIKQNWIYWKEQSKEDSHPGFWMCVSFMGIPYFILF